MDLGEIRAQFIITSGRQDLVKTVGEDTNTDDGANFYINSGQRLLDNMIDYPAQLSRYQKDITAGTFTVSVQYLRSLFTVHVANADGRTELINKSYEWLRNEYRDGFDNVDQGTPLYYSAGPAKTSPQQRDLTSENYTDEFTYDHQDIVWGDNFDYRVVTIMPPPDGTFTIVVAGRYNQPVMSTDTDETWWSVNYPFVLIQATSAALETAYRNTEGFKDWIGAIRLSIDGIDKDSILEDMFKPVKMKG